MISENFDQNRDFSKILSKVENFPKIWPNLRLFLIFRSKLIVSKILTKIEIIRKIDKNIDFRKKVDQNRDFEQFWSKSRFFENFQVYRDFSKIVYKIKLSEFWT